MNVDDQLDREIDEEMGWTVDLRKKDARRATGSLPGFSLLSKLVLPLGLRQAARKILRGFFKVIFFPLISPLGYSRKFNLEGDMMVVKRTWKWRIVDGLITRLLITPVILGIFMTAVVYSSTHPRRVMASATPESMGLYFKRLHLVTNDGQGLAAWYVPPITAEEMEFDPEASIAQKWPAVVLCHGLGSSHDQYLSLAHTLHKAGFAILMLDTRGQGESEAAAITYGVREQFDVVAGVKYLRELPNINGSRICVVGHDISAIAALEAASLDSAVAAVVADGMWPRFEDRARNIFSRPGGRDLPTGWLAPLYTAAFEISLRDRLSQIDPQSAVRNIHTQPVFFVARRGDVYAPVQEVMTLATNVGGHHEMMVADEGSNGGEVEMRIRDFLMQSTGWKGPHGKGISELQKLLDSRVK